MGLGGTILGGLIGSFLAGPVGALIGAGIGAYASRNKTEEKTETGFAGNPVENDAHLAALFRSLGKLAKADGIVSQGEADFAKELLSDLQLPAEQRAKLIAAFSDGKNSPESFRQMADSVAAAFQQDAYPNIMRIYCMMALASGAVSSEEQALLLDAEKCFRLNGYTERFFRQAGRKDTSGSGSRSSYTESGSGSELAEAYRILGITSSASNDEVKKAWRKKAMEFHPDKIQGKGLPEAFINFANEETRKINAAYDAIRKERGIL